jgi:hypothetical protein
MTKSEQMLMKLHDAIKFITRPLALPREVVTEAAEAAMNVIRKYFKERNEHEEMV